MQSAILTNSAGQIDLGSSKRILGISVTARSTSSGTIVTSTIQTSLNGSSWTSTGKSIVYALPGTGNYDTKSHFYSVDITARYINASHSHPANISFWQMYVIYEEILDGFYIARNNGTVINKLDGFLKDKAIGESVTLQPFSFGGSQKNIDNLTNGKMYKLQNGVMSEGYE